MIEVHNGVNSITRLTCNHCMERWWHIKKPTDDDPHFRVINILDEKELEKTNYKPSSKQRAELIAEYTKLFGPAPLNDDEFESTLMIRNMIRLVNIDSQLHYI